MTWEEIIKWLESLKAEIGKSEHRSLWHYAEAIDMAIEALQEQTTSTIPTFAESAEAYKAWTGEEMGRPHGRLIDADKLKEQLDTVYNEMANERERKGLRLARWFLISAPTVSTDRPHGEWEHTEEVTTMDGLHWHVWRCTNCNSSGNPDMNYCPNCGAYNGGDGE